jgi:hypothetical protein
MAMARNVLSSLLGVRQEDERRAERALQAALAARGRAEAEEARLRGVADRARADLAGRRRQDRDDVDGLEGPDRGGKAGSTARAADELARQRFLARLLGDVEAGAAVVAVFARDTLGPARAAEETARAAHLRARQKRQVVERALARREAVQRLETDRRAETASDDLRGRPPPVRRDRGSGKSK